MTSSPQVLIAGGGATGVALAVQLLRRGATVTLVERRETPGQGIAYSTRDPVHLLNTRSAAMSAFPDRPDDFVDWLSAEGLDSDPTAFASRLHYGRYLLRRLEDWRGHPRLRLIHDEAVAAWPEGEGMALRLGGGEMLRGDRLVLATGHPVPEPEPGVRQPWGNDGPAPDGRVVIVGSGLTMVDEVLSLLAAGHRGGILAVSRRGLLPRPHLAEPPRPVALGNGLPVGAGPARLVRWIRQRVAAEEAAGGDWRGVVDAIRPEVQTLWRAMDISRRRVFLRHGAVWWDVHRHRMPPDSQERLDAAMAAGELDLLRAAFEGTEPDGTVRLRLRDGTARRVAAAAVIDCRGIRRDPEKNASPLIASLLASGQGRIDPLRLGLEVTPLGAVIAADGNVSGRLHAAGPPSRAALWEITAMPDIREQVARLAAAFAPSCD